METSFGLPSPMSVSFVLHGAALVAIYSLYGLLQEKVIKTSYGPNVEHFESTSLLILCNRCFAMAFAVLIVAVKHRGSSTAILRHLRPTAPLKHFAYVAGWNFLSSSCQYQALAFVSFTTASLAKTTKMVPIIIVGGLVYKRQTSFRDWTAAVVISAGCCVYLSTTTGAEPPREEEREAYFEGLLGALYLAGYLLFDALTSTSQQAYFGLSASSTDPFAADSSVISQMIYVNLFTCLYSIGGLGIDLATGTLASSLRLLLTTPALQRDIFFLSAAAAVGLVVLLNTISSFGALSSALLMTIRQFTGIVLNAGIFRHYLSVGLQGWCGVGWVASGVWIKMNASADNESNMEPFETLPTSPHAEKALLPEADEQPSRSPSRSNSALPSYHLHDPAAKEPSPAWYIRHYALPIAAPLLFSAVLLVIYPELGARISQPESNLGSIQYATHSQNGKNTGEFVAVEGGMWEKELVDVVWPECNASATQRWEGSTKTALASFPRSGNTFTRELVERSSHWQTSTVGYCDHALRVALHGECDDDAKFLVKTHYPEQTSEHDEGYLDLQGFQQAVHLVRNPVDALISGWQLAHVPKTQNGQLDHAGRLEVDHALGSFAAERSDIIERARKYQNHWQFWTGVSVQTHLVRYEDIMATRLPSLLSMLAFLLPADGLPSLAQIACALELNEEAEAYKSRKAPDFASWDQWDPTLRTEVITMLKEPWCALGYQHLLRKTRGTETGVDALCLQL